MMRALACPRFRPPIVGRNGGGSIGNYNFNRKP